MAYGLRYKAEYRNTNNDLITINLLKNGYTGTTVTINEVVSYAQVKYRSQEGQSVVGSELSFSFVTKNKTTFQDLLTSNYKDFQVEMLINGVKDWSGWLVIDNITTSYFDYVYTFNLSANDGLAELDRFKITGDGGTQISGNNSLLWYIKQAVKFNNIPLDFGIILNTKEVNTMTLATDNALAKSNLLADRFIEINSGKKDYFDAKRVIDEILKTFNAVLYQSGGKYWIVNQLEVGSTIYYHNFSDLLQTSTATNSTGIDISLKKLDRTNELAKKRPLKRVSATYQNKNVPASLVPNGDFSTTDVTFWNHSPAPEATTFAMGVVENEMSVEAAGTNLTSSILATDPIAIERKTNDDKIIVQFDYYLKSITYNSTSSVGFPPYLEVELFLDGVSVDVDGFANFLEKDKATFKGSFLNRGTGNYTIKIYDRTSDEGRYDSISYRIDNFSVIAQVADGADSNTTFDRFYSATNTNTTAIDVEDENIILIGDGIQSTDIGNLKVGTTLTKQWNTFGKTEGLNLQYLYILNQLRLKQKFNNQLRLTVIADDFQRIGFNNHIIFDGIRYIITEYAVRYGETHTAYNLTLLELPTTDITFDTGLVTLNSVDGEEPAKSTKVNETDPTVPDHVKSIKTSDITNWNGKTSTLDETLTAGNTTNKGIVLKSPDGLQSVTISLDNNNHVLFDGANISATGNISAFSSLTPPAADWWRPATTTQLGAVIVGSGLSIDVNGLLTADAQSLQPATTTTLGGVKVGTGINVTLDGTISAQEIDTSTLVLKAGDTMSGTLTSNAGSTTRGVLEVPDVTQWVWKLSAYDLGCYWDTTGNHINFKNIYGDLKYNGNTVYNTGNDSGLAKHSIVGETSVTTPAGGAWFRIAATSGNRAFGTFTISDENSGMHQVTHFNVAVAYGSESRFQLNIIGGTRYGGAQSFSKFRILENTSDIYAPIYLEVYATQSLVGCQVVMTDNEWDSGWTLQNFSTGAIPTGYSSKEYSIRENEISVNDKKVWHEGDHVLVINNTSHTVEGAELQFLAAGTNAKWHIDAYGGDLRFFGGSGRIDNQKALLQRGDVHLMGRIYSHSTGDRDSGMYGTYDSYKTHHIWSIGSSWAIPSDGTTFGNLYGIAYKHTNNTTGGAMAGGHQAVFTNNGTGGSAIGFAGNIWTSGWVHAGGNITAYSDSRIKTDVSTITDASDIVSKLRGVRYKRTDTEVDKVQVGVIAQEVKEVLPEVVEYDESVDRYSVNYQVIVGVLIEAIKDLQNEVAKLKKGDSK